MGEVVPAGATIIAGRRTPPLFGLGLVDAVPDAIFLQLAESQRVNTPQTAGVANIVFNPILGRMAVGKFGLKAQVPSLRVFSADAYLNEMLQ